MNVPHDEKRIFEVTSRYVEKTTCKHPYESAARELFGDSIHETSADFSTAVILCRATYFMHRIGGVDGYNRLTASIKKGVEICANVYNDSPNELREILNEIRATIIEQSAGLDSLIKVLIMKGVIEAEEFGRAMYLELSNRVQALEAKLQVLSEGKVFIP